MRRSDGDGGRRLGAPGRTEPLEGKRVLCQRCARRRSGRAAFIAMVQPADGGQGHDTSRLDCCYGSRLGRIFRQRQVRTRPVVVVDIRR